MSAEHTAEFHHTFVHIDGTVCDRGFAWCPNVSHRSLGDFRHHVQPGAERTDCGQPRGALSTSTAVADATCPACLRAGGGVVIAENDQSALARCTREHPDHWGLYYGNSCDECWESWTDDFRAGRVTPPGAPS